METDKQIVEMVEGAMKAGAAGISIGRNAFQHKDPTKIVSVFSKMVHKKLSAKDALKMLRK